MTSRYFFPLLTMAVFTITAGGAMAQAAGPFTQDQVTAGRKDFGDYCAGCHGDNLAGGGESPPLTGAVFNHDWATQTVGGFYAFIANAMPQGLEGSLKPEEYAAITAYIMAANGAKPGTTAFAGKSDIKINTIADGKLVPGVMRGK